MSVDRNDLAVIEYSIDGGRQWLHGRTVPNDPARLSAHLTSVANEVVDRYRGPAMVAAAAVLTRVAPRVVLYPGGILRDELTDVVCDAADALGLLDLAAKVRAVDALETVVRERLATARSDSWDAGFAAGGSTVQELDAQIAAIRAVVADAQCPDADRIRAILDGD